MFVYIFVFMLYRCRFKNIVFKYFQVTLRYLENYSRADEYLQHSFKALNL